MTDLKFKKAEHLNELLITKAWESENFKSALINDPKTAIEQAIGAELAIPEGSQIIVEDQTDPNVIYINIPRQVDIDDVELTDEQLENVAGGVDPLTVIGGIVAICQAVDWIVEGYNNYP